MARRGGERQRPTAVCRHPVELVVTRAVDHVGRVDGSTVLRGADPAEVDDVLRQVAGEGSLDCEAGAPGRNGPHLRCPGALACEQDGIRAARDFDPWPGRTALGPRVQRHGRALRL